MTASRYVEEGANCYYRTHTSLWKNLPTVVNMHDISFNNAWLIVLYSIDESRKNMLTTDNYNIKKLGTMANAVIL